MALGVRISSWVDVAKVRLIKVSIGVEKVVNWGQLKIVVSLYES